MKFSTFLTLIILLISTNMEGQIGPQLSDYGTVLNNENELIALGYKSEVFKIIRSVSNADIYHLAENPSTQSTFKEEADYLKYKSKGIEVIAFLDQENLISKILLELQYIEGIQAYEKDDLFTRKKYLYLINSCNRFDILRAEGFHGNRFDRLISSFNPVTVAEIIKVIKDWDKKYGVELVSAGSDYIHVSFDSIPINLKEFVKTLVALCPDVIDQGYMTKENLIKEFIKTKSITLWWD